MVDAQGGARVLMGHPSKPLSYPPFVVTDVHPVTDIYHEHYVHRPIVMTQGVRDGFRKAEQLLDARRQSTHSRTTKTTSPTRTSPCASTPVSRLPMSFAAVAWASMLRARTATERIKLSCEGKALHEPSAPGRSSTRRPEQD